MVRKHFFLNVVLFFSSLRSFVAVSTAVFSILARSICNRSMTKRRFKEANRPMKVTCRQCKHALRETLMIKNISKWRAWQRKYNNKAEHNPFLVLDRFNRSYGYPLWTAASPRRTYYMWIYQQVLVCVLEFDMHLLASLMLYILTHWVWLLSSHMKLLLFVMFVWRGTFIPFNQSL